MLTKELLEKIGFKKEDADYIIELNQKNLHKIKPLVEEYTMALGDNPFLKYKDGKRKESLRRTEAFIEGVREKLPELDEKTARLLGWVNSIPKLYKNYKKHEISEDVFFSSMRDFTYKLKECKDVYGTFGLFTDWFFLFFDLKMFALGRLQYEVCEFLYDEYSCQEFTLKKGDTVYYCHIPSSGSLTTNLCMDSFRKAYEFFKPQLEGDIIPIISYTWLFYKPYLDKVFLKGSNVEKFVNLFDIIDSKSDGNRFDDCWRVFNKMYDGTTRGLPSDNTLRRNFIKYIDDGGDFGGGYGVILYNGKTGEIINKK